MTDKAYEEARNQLIETAMKAAYDYTGVKPKWTKKTDHLCEKWNNDWNTVYFKTMNDLARAKGIL